MRVVTMMIKREKKKSTRMKRKTSHLLQLRKIKARRSRRKMRSLHGERNRSFRRVSREVLGPPSQLLRPRRLHLRMSYKFSQRRCWICLQREITFWSR